MATPRVGHSPRPAKPVPPVQPGRARARRTPKRQRPDRSWRTALAPGGSLWRDGQPATFTRDELAEKWLLVKEIEQAKGRRSFIAQLARAIHAAHRRQSHAAERWLRGQLATLEVIR
jgi:hypothetical protein